MSEKYYIVSESELDNYERAVWRHSNIHPMHINELEEAYDCVYKAEAACRTRPVPEHAMSFYCREYNKENPRHIIKQWYEEIKR
jgi:hypothetical protein